MENITTFIQPFFDWLLQTTLIGSVVICLILIVQKMLGGRLGPRWCHALWLVLLMRMILPWAPSSRISLVNLIPSWDRQIQIQQLSETTRQQEVSQISQTSDSSDVAPAERPESVAEIQKQATAKPGIVLDLQKEPQQKLASMRQALPVLWLAGAIVVGVYILLSDFALWRIVKHDRPLVDQEMLELFEECKTQMNVQSLVVVIPSGQVRSPGLFGFIRPRLLLPREMLDTATREEMRYVFLHELAHLKRRDIYLGWLTSLLQILHWFNPLVWFAFYRMRMDRELACDALVLARTQKEESQEYGRAIVGLLRRFSRSRPLPAMAGILENRSQLKRRITMIAQFKKKSYQWSALAVILIVILACISLPDAKGTRASRIKNTQPAPHISLRRVWSGPDVDTSGAVSPDGRYLSYVDYRDSGDLAIYEISTGKKRRLTNQANEVYLTPMERAFYPRWSPDGKQIAYCWWREGEFIDLRVIGLDILKPRILYSNKKVGWIDNYDWSPDGKHILASFGRKDVQQIVLVSTVDGSVRVLKTFEKQSPSNACFSPDGDYIVYDFPQKEDSPEHDIYLLSVDGSREISLVEHPAHDFVLGWAPDGENILFASDRTVNLSSWLIAVADGKPQGAPELVKSDIMRQFEPLGFTRDGSFYFGYGGSNIKTRGKKNDVYVAKLDRETGEILIPPKKMIQRFEGFNRGPSYSPDGKYLAYISTRGTLGPKYRSPVLCIRSLETGQERVLLPKLKNFALKCWSSDCGSIRVSGLDNKDRKGIFQIDAQTGEVTPIVLSDEDKDVISYCQWSRDGKSIFYTRNNDTNDFCQIIFRDLETGIEKLLYHAPKKEILRFGISLSPDGNWLAFINFNVFGFYNTTREGKRVLKIMPATGGQPRELYTFVHNWNNRPIPITWTVDGKYILFLREKPNKDDPKWELCRISTEGGEPHELGLEVKRNEFYSPSFHPDGQHITFQSTTRAPTEVWVMENFLPETPVAKPANQPKFIKIQIPNRIHSDAQFSPDGKKIALGFEKKIWIMPRSSKLGADYPGTPTLLDTGEVNAHWFGFTWSGDGQWIAFNRKQLIYIVSAEGSKPKQVYESNRGVCIINYRMSLSPHGKTLAFSSVNANEQYIYTIGIDDVVPKRLVEAPAREPVFSPDGKMIAYVEDKNLGRGGGGLWTVPSYGGTPTLVAKAGNASSPVWSPDGKMITFLDYAVGNQIYIVPISEDGKPVGEKITIDCPEGIKEVKRLAGWTSDNAIGMVFQNQQEFALYIQPVQGGKATFLTHGKYPLQPRWSPDGKQIYHTNIAGEASGDWQRLAIAHVSAKGGDVTTVPIQSEAKIVIWGYGAGNHVSPDGSTIVFAGRKSQESIGIKHIWTLPIEGGKPKQLTNAPVRFTDWYPCWSPNGKAIAFLRSPTSKDLVANVYIVPANGGESRQLTSESDMVFSASTIAWSPDGKLLAYFSRDDKTGPDGTIKVIPVEGGEPQVVVKVKSIYANKEMAWSPDSKQIAFNEANVIKIVSLEARNVIDVKPDLQDTGIYHLDWSPDGQSLVFAGDKGGDLDVWTMENFLPESTAGK